MRMKLKDLLRGTLSDSELDYLIQSYDLVGDMAITIIPPELSHRQRLIGEAILATNKRIKVVAKRDGLHHGEFRTIPLKIVAGEQRKETLHVEFGVRLLVNPEQVYFSVRSGSERKRVADLVLPGEDVLVMFSGVAPYPLMVNRFSRAASIVGIESNPLAHGFALRNLKLNRAEDRVSVFCGDVAEVLPRLEDSYHRIIMPLPTASLDYLPLALNSLRTGGTIHLYYFRPTGSVNNSLIAIDNACRTAGRKVAHATEITCGHTSPGTSRSCFDCLIE